MVYIPVKFKRVADAFHDLTRARSCESSGSEHSADLFDLVNSFIEREIREQREIEEVDHQDTDQGNNGSSNDDESESNSRDLELKDSLKKCFDIGNDDVKRRSIRAEVEEALVELGGNEASSSPEFKRRLMARLRDKGFEAGLCKSKWQKSGSCNAGVYEYIDINTTNETRYIIEVSLAGEFTIARPTSQFSSLLEAFPPLFIGQPNELKQIVKLMSKAIRKSMKTMNIDISPWRRLAYLQAKWFGPYKRTTNEVSFKNVSKIVVDGEKGWKRSVGFVPVGGLPFNCREKYAAKSGVRVGNLALALKQEETVR